MAQMLPMAFANIERVDILTNVSGGSEVFTIETASEANAEANVSAGEDKELRVKNQILAQNVTEDIVKGYNITLNDVLFTPDVFALVDGGVSVKNNSDEFVMYDGPVAGQVVSRTKFWMIVYTAEKDCAGITFSYTAFVFPNCCGSPASVSFRDGEFFAPAYTIKSKPGKGTSPMRIVNLPSLPVAVSNASELAAVTHEAQKSTILLTVNGQHLLGTGQELGDIFTEDSTAKAKKGTLAVCYTVTVDDNNAVTAFKYKVRA